MKKSVIIAITAALAVACTQNPAGQAAFDAILETRSHPIKVVDSIASWQPSGEALSAVTGEYFTFQIGIEAYEELSDVRVVFEDLSSGPATSGLATSGPATQSATSGGRISAGAMTCFNTEGIDSYGKPFSKNVRIAAGKLQPLWIGVDLEGVTPGTYRGTVEVCCEQGKSKIPVCIAVEDGSPEEKGCSNGKNLSRLSWLNSTLGQEDEVIRGLSPISRDGGKVSIFGRELTIGPDGLPAGYKSYFNKSVESLNSAGFEVLSSPMVFKVILSDGREVRLSGGCSRGAHFGGEESETSLSWTARSRSCGISLECHARMEFDGWVDYDIIVRSHKNLDIKDISLEMPMSEGGSLYTMGLGLEGGLRPAEDYRWKWDVSKHQDMLWIGGVDGGVRLMLKDENYRKPLVNIYYEYGKIVEPESWSNGARGGVLIENSGDGALVKAFSGERHMSRGETLHFGFELLLTPFKLVDRNIKYGDRYHHGGPDEMSQVLAAEREGANVVNIHHCQPHYPFINYPYLDEGVDTLKMVINEAHKRGQRLKVYYTTRELTKNIPEFWAFNSLQGEVLFPGPGNECRTLIHPEGPSEWLKENLKERYIPAWYCTIGQGQFKGEIDLSVLTTPDSRLNNFYIGGLDWMLRNMQIDGVYVDDSALDRVTVRRARRLIDRYRPEGRIDMHSWNHFCKEAGYANCANIYMDLMPYLDLTWIGEGRDYDRMPDHWLIEVSSIPFGLPGQMLQDGGNRWRGMIYGMTNREGWQPDGPHNIWKFWDEQDIASKELIGYWDDRSPVTVSSDMVKASVYVGGLAGASAEAGSSADACSSDSVILAVACWGDSDVECDIDVDWEALGLDPSRVRLTRPEIEGYQSADANPSLTGLRIPRGRGYLFVIE